MGTPVHAQRLRNLALVYLALAHDTDHDLTNDEVDAITARLRPWAAVSAGTVVGALKQAMDLYASGEGDAHVRAALASLHDDLSDGERAQIVEDLMEIAEADGRFLFRESTFIGDVTRAWNLRSDDEA